MGRRGYAMTTTKLNRFIRERRGKGEGASYKPWLKVQDVPSRGRSHRVSCLKTGGREMHFLSDHEYAAFLDAWWDSSVLDIREQFPIDIQRTIAIAADLQIKHPRDPRTNVLLTQTTDFLLTIGPLERKTYVALSVKGGKNKEHLFNERTLDKLDIERFYWLEENVPWNLVLNAGLNSNRAGNLDWIFQCELWIRASNQPDEDCIHRVLAKIRERSNQSAGSTCYWLDKKTNCAPGSHMTALRFLFLTRIIEGNLDNCKLHRQALSSIRIVSP
jgi:hypothetical protein